MGKLKNVLQNIVKIRYFVFKNMIFANKFYESISVSYKSGTNA